MGKIFLFAENSPTAHRVTKSQKIYYKVQTNINKIKFCTDTTITLSCAAPHCRGDLYQEKVRYRLSCSGEAIGMNENTTFSLHAIEVYL
jgi:hypothetical protein